MPSKETINEDNKYSFQKIVHRVKGFTFWRQKLKTKRKRKQKSKDKNVRFNLSFANLRRLSTVGSF